MSQQTPAPSRKPTRPRGEIVEADKARDQLLAREAAERTALFGAQAAHGRERRLQKLARREPATRQLFAELQALREENARLKAQSAAPRA